MPNGLAWLDFIMVILATYRLAQLFSKDDGPLNVFKNMRGNAKSRRAYYQGIMTNGSIPEGERFIANKLFIFWHNVWAWLECPYCNGVCFSAICLLVLQFKPVGWWVLAWLAVAGAQAFLQDVSQR